jgi:hypothetical protein
MGEETSIGQTRLTRRMGILLILGFGIRLCFLLRLAMRKLQVGFGEDLA